MSETALMERGCTPSLWQAETKSQPGSASPVRARLLDEEQPASLEVGGEASPGLGLEGDVGGLATLALPEADECPLEVEVSEPPQTRARVTGRRRLEDRDDRPVAKVERLDSESFYRYVNSTDELTLVVRGHLSLEAVLNHVLDRARPRGLTEEFDSLRFPQRVDLAIALGKLDIESRPAWMKINAIRNRFAHDLHGKITNKEARETLAMLPAWWAPPPVGTLDHPLGPQARSDGAWRCCGQERSTRACLATPPSCPSSWTWRSFRAHQARHVQPPNVGLRGGVRPAAYP